MPARIRVELDKERETVVAYLQEGRTCKETAQLMGIPHERVSKRLREAGLSRKPLDKEKAVGLYLEGKTTEEVGDILGVSRTTIDRAVREAKVTRSGVDRMQLASSQGRVGAKLKGRKQTAEHVANTQRTKAENALETSRDICQIEGGYYLLKVAHRDDWVPLHRLMMECHIRRRLRPDEIVHHIDHDPSNNNISNLQIMSRQEHLDYHRDVRLMVIEAEQRMALAA